MGLDVFEDALDCLGVFDQGFDRGGEQNLETLERTMDRARAWLFTYFGSSWLDGVGIER
jgi:hypothetical protein